VLSFIEGKPTKLAELPLPLRGKSAVFSAVVVPPESAYPGFGEAVVLTEHDHIDECKPAGRSDESYALTLALIREVVQEAMAANGQTKQTA
jgi:hypothetical protein